jgi:hypothetical protein
MRYNKKHVLQEIIIKDSEKNAKRSINETEERKALQREH